jgi:hypothetical protein
MIDDRNVIQEKVKDIRPARVSVDPQDEMGRYRYDDDDDI